MSEVDADNLDRGRSCDRCGDDIHDLVPATVLSLSGGVESDELVVCAGCSEGIVDWWERGDAIAE